MVSSLHTAVRLASRRFSTVSFDSARAAHELELAKINKELKLCELAQAEKLKLSELAQAEKLEFAKLAQDKELKLAELQSGRGFWETVFKVKRETAQALNVGFGGLFFLASSVYIMSGMLHGFQTTLMVTKDKAESAQQDVRSLMANVQRAFLSTTFSNTYPSPSATRGEIATVFHGKHVIKGTYFDDFYIDLNSMV